MRTKLQRNLAFFKNSFDLVCCSSCVGYNWLITNQWRWGGFQFLLKFGAVLNWLFVSLFGDDICLFFCGTNVFLQIPRPLQNLEKHFQFKTMRELLKNWDICDCHFLFSVTCKCLQTDFQQYLTTWVRQCKELRISKLLFFLPFKTRSELVYFSTEKW